MRGPGCAVSPSAKRWAWNLGRIAVTALALWVVLRLIQLEDFVSIREAGKKPVETADAAIESAGAGGVVLRWKDGHTSRHAPGAVEARPGLKTIFERTRKGLYFAMVVALFIPLAFISLRWWLLLRGHGFQVSFGRVFFMTYAGAFFNKFLPGAVGGDLTRALLAVSGEERKAAAVATVVLDRVIGLAVMIVLGAACLTPYVGRFEDKRLAILVYGLFGGMVLGYLLYFSPLLRRAVGSRLPFQKVRQELDGVFRSVKEKKGLVAVAAVLSLGAQTSGIVIIYGIARAMGLENAHLWAFFIFEPIIFIVTAVPASLGGWGVQELVYKETFGRFGGMEENQAIGLSILFSLAWIVVSIPGGLLFAMGAARRRPQPRRLENEGV
jgi:uncharacterized protein (TIRG00374 family)